MSLEFDPREYDSPDYIKKVKKLTCEIIRSGTAQQVRELREACFDLSFPEKVRDAVYMVLTLNGISVDLKMRREGVKPVFQVDNAKVSREERVQKLKESILREIDEEEEGEK